LSTLTKVLIVLLTVSSIFLCGIVVTYVANADNYRQRYEDLRSQTNALKKKNEDLTKQVNEQIADKDAMEKKLRGQIASLNTELAGLKNELKEVDREKETLLQKVNSWTSIVKDFSETNDKQGQLLKNTLEELKKIQSEQIRQGKELNETTTTLIEKMAVIDALESEKRRLLEEKTDLQARLENLLQPEGRIEIPAPVTPEKDTVRPEGPQVRQIDLRGAVTAVDLKNSMAGISIGSADGVKENMKFHVTRGDEFICDILIIDVDTAESVGLLELVQQPPQVGDNVSTSFF
jgi:cell division protein FtsL